MANIHTTCNRDCPDACGMIATVEDGRVTRLRGDPDHPVTRGFLCHRTGEYLLTQYSPDRLLTPLIRRGGELCPATWEEAIRLIAERMTAIRAESGPQAIFHYRSGGSLGMVKAVTDLFFERFGPVTTKSGDICSGAGDAAQMADFGEEDSHDVFDLLNSRHILLWGKNPVVSSPHLVPILRDARARGTTLISVDPVWHQSSRLANRSWQPRPAGDFALAIATAAVLFERGDVDPEAANYCDNLDAFRALALSRSPTDWCVDADLPLAAAEDIATCLASGPTAILVGWGMGRRANGGAIVRALDALGAISGNLGIAGGGVSFYFKRRRAFRPPECAQPDELCLVASTENATVQRRTISEITMGADLLASNPPVRMMWVTAGNPVVMLPDSVSVAKAISTREFVVVVDCFLTDTAALADVVLPTTTILEEDDIVGAYGNHWIGVVRPVVSRPEGVRSDLEITQLLASRLGIRGFEDDARAWKERMLAPALVAAGVDLALLEAGPVRNPLAPPMLFADRVFSTASGRVNLVTEAVPAAPDVPGFPLWLLSISTEKSQSSQWAHEPVGLITATVHPDSSPVPDGQTARLQSQLGEFLVRVRHDERQRKDVVILPKGGHFRAGRAANALVQARVTDMGEGGALYDERVRLIV